MSMPLSSKFNFPSSTANVIDCDFEGGDMCGWTNADYDHFEWTLRSGVAPSNGTGPYYDHTLHDNSGIGHATWGPSQYKDPLTTVLSLTWGSPYLGKTVFILRQGPEGHYWDYYPGAYPKVKSLQLFWWSVTGRFHLRMPDLSKEL